MFFAAADPKAHDLDQVNTVQAVFDAAYEAAKAAVLRAGAQGLLEVTAVHEWTGLLGDLRRAVEQAHKAAQHLAALPRLKPTPPANGPASVTPGAE